MSIRHVAYLTFYILHKAPMKAQDFVAYCSIHSLILAIFIVPLHVLHYSEALPTTAQIHVGLLNLSFTPKSTDNCMQTTRIFRWVPGKSAPLTRSFPTLRLGLRLTISSLTL